MLTREQVQAKIETSYCLCWRDEKYIVILDLGCDKIDDKGQVEIHVKGSSQSLYVDWSFLATDNVTFYKLQEN